MSLEDPPRKQQGKASFHPNRRKKKKKLMTSQNLRWAITIVGWTFAISIVLSFVSDRAMESVSVAVAFCVLLCFIILGIVFDILGLAVATASEKPFHSMASRRVKGSFEALKLIRRADRVSNFCNDVVGDICGIISGATGAAIIVRFAAEGTPAAMVFSLVISGLVAAVTVGGKALGKSFAMEQSTRIVLFVGRILYAVGAFRREVFSKKG